jgi:hypothetical protein
VTIRLAGARPRVIGSSADDAYGEVEYVYAGRTATSRSTDQREILSLLYGLAGTAAPVALSSDGYAGFPLVANAEPAGLWFFGALPLAIVIAWWWSHRPPRTIYPSRVKEVSHETHAIR